MKIEVKCSDIDSKRCSFVILISIKVYCESDFKKYGVVSEIYFTEEVNMVFKSFHNTSLVRPISAARFQETDETDAISSPQ